MVAPTAGLRVSTSGAAASTETVCSRLPSSIFTGMTGLLPTWRTRPGLREGAEPRERRFEAIRPDRKIQQRVRNRCHPSPPRDGSRSQSGSAITVTPGSTAPLASATGPVDLRGRLGPTQCAAENRTTIRASSGREMRLITEHSCCPN
jgi:hypothetical protein